MATIKIKYRNSSVEGKQGTLVFQVIHNRVVRQKKTDYKLFVSEWDPLNQDIILPLSNNGRRYYLQGIRDRIHSHITMLNSIIAGYERAGKQYTSNDIIDQFNTGTDDVLFFSYMESIIYNYRIIGRIRTAEGYQSALNSFRKFCNGTDMPIYKIDHTIMLSYESYLKKNNISPNSSSFYMRNLRAVYNKAVECNYTTQQYPFKYVYTGVEKTIKRALSVRSLKKIIEIPLSDNPALDYARDIFLFSFFTRGMSMIDIAYLKKKDLSNGILSYRRRKTGQLLHIKWEACMQTITDKYKDTYSEYLLPIITPQRTLEVRKQYIYASHNINRSLKIIGKLIGLDAPLTMYVARHSWASIANSKNVPISVISQGMGHNSEKTTRIYIASLENSAIDKANRSILNLCTK